MSYLLAGLKKDPHGDRVVTQQRQEASPYSSIHVYLWMSLTVRCATHPCACKEQRGALPSKAASRSKHEPELLPPIVILSKTTYSTTPWQKSFCTSRFAFTETWENILSSFEEIRLPDSTKEPTQQSSKLLCIQCFLCFVLPWNINKISNCWGKYPRHNGLVGQLDKANTSDINNLFLCHHCLVHL